MQRRVARARAAIEEALVQLNGEADRRHRQHGGVVGEVLAEYHTARVMLTIGSTITRKGWEARSGPTCSDACCRNKAATLPTTRA
jgi:hypothetical protein